MEASRGRAGLRDAVEDFRRYNGQETGRRPGVIRKYAGVSACHVGPKIVRQEPARSFSEPLVNDCDWCACASCRTESSQPKNGRERGERLEVVIRLKDVKIEPRLAASVGK